MKQFKRLSACLTITALVVVVPAGGSSAARKEIPAWAREAVNYLADRGLVDKSAFDADAPMPRRRFRQLMVEAFGGGYSRTQGKVTAGEVDAALVRVLDRKSLADALLEIRSPDGWDPGVHQRFGSEVVARELGLRFNRPTGEESMEAAAESKLRQADIAFAVWKALTAPNTSSADTLINFALDDYSEDRREVVSFALSLAGAPYVWGGEWRYTTPDAYPYGAQKAGGFDCSGFIWYVLQQRSASYSPVDRPYKGWSIPERSSSEMAKATPRSKRLDYKQLKPGDIVLFAPGGAGSSRPRDVYHAGLYLGRGWMVHSSGSRAGVSLASIAPETWWHSEILFGRRIIP
jgi:cell wall-associated NlpC family hydrolase